MLEQAWEAQPDMPLATIWGQLEMRGIGWGSPDSALVGALEEILSKHPASLAHEDIGERVIIIDTQSPARRVSIDGVRGRITVRSLDQSITPVSFVGFSLVRARVSAPLVIEDSEGFHHKFGVIRSITTHNPPSARNWERLSKEQLENNLLGVWLASGDLAVIGHTIKVYEAARREMSVASYQWDELHGVGLGQPLTFLRGGAVKQLGEIADVFYIETVDA